jgi:hypothetical protein
MAAGHMLAQNGKLPGRCSYWADAFLKKIAIFITQLYYCSGFLITLTQNSIHFHYFNY